MLLEEVCEPVGGSINLQSGVSINGMQSGGVWRCAALFKEYISESSSRSGHMPNNLHNNTNKSGS